MQSMDGGRKAAALLEGRIIHLLAEWNPGDRSSDRPGETALAARLGEWVGWRDAVDLAAALTVPVRTGRLERSASSLESGVLALSELRTRLAQPLEGPGPTDRAPEASLHDNDACFVSGRRLYLARRQSAARAIGSLRIHLRGLLVEAGAERLAAIDAVMEQILETKQEALFARLLHALERRSSARVNETSSSTPLDMLQDMQQAWEAELEHRLLPLEGLAEALRTRIAYPR